MSQAPPFELPGFTWDPVYVAQLTNRKRRFFKRQNARSSNKPRCPSPHLEPPIETLRRAPLGHVTGHVRYTSTSKYCQYLMTRAVQHMHLSHTYSAQAWVLNHTAPIQLIPCNSSTHFYSYAVATCDGRVLCIQGTGLQDEPSRLSTGPYFTRSQILPQENDYEHLVLLSSASQTRYACTSTSQLLVEVSMHTRWVLSLTSTCDSPYRVQVSFHDPSRKPQGDIRCIDAVDLDASRMLIAIGAGRRVHLVQVHILAEKQADWHMYTKEYPSDVMCVTIRSSGASTCTDVLCGLRSGNIQTMRMGPDDTWLPEITFSFASKGALCHIQCVHDTLFVAAYTNGDLVMGDITRMRDAPLRFFKGHVNQFMQGLVRILLLTQGFDVDPIHHMLACSGSDQRVRIWSLNHADPVCVLPPPGTHDQFPQHVQALAWSRTSDRPLTLAVACGQDVQIFACGPT